ncbi:acylphosphatase [bacterium]|nr:acylphosphatase [bacterium]
MEYRTLHVLVSGQVQGVGYRAATQRTAASLGLTGWVRNLPDGRVEACVQGPSEALQEILAWFEDGSPRSQVTDVESRELENQPPFEGFEIRRGS